MDPHPQPTPSPGPRGRRPPIEAVDLDPRNRPGIPKERRPEPWPNARVPERMTARPSVPRHGRPDEPMPPVYGTAVPPSGVSGVLRKAAYRYPDHHVSHWTLLLLADRVEAWGLRARRVLPFAVPLLAAGFLARRVKQGRR